MINASSKFQYLLCIVVILFSLFSLLLVFFGVEEKVIDINCFVSIVIQLDLVSGIISSQTIFCKENSIKVCLLSLSLMNVKLVQVLNYHVFLY